MTSELDLIKAGVEFSRDGHKVAVKGPVKVGETFKQAVLDRIQLVEAWLEIGEKKLPRPPYRYGECESCKQPMPDYRGGTCWVCCCAIQRVLDDRRANIHKAKEGADL